MAAPPHTTPCERQRLGEGRPLWRGPSRQAHRHGVPRAQAVGPQSHEREPAHKHRGVRASATSLPGLWVARPSGTRASSKVPSLRHRLPHQGRMCRGGEATCVASQACGSYAPGGARPQPQRLTTGGKPDVDHPPGSVSFSTARVAPPDHGATAIGVHGVCGSASRGGGAGRRAPCTRGRPWCPGLRAGAGFHTAASSRPRVLTHAGGM